jgi:FKBP-type peptidyl-prolyl cis-trans isomerase FkpA
MMAHKNRSDYHCLGFIAVSLLLFSTACQKFRKGDGDMWYQIVEHKAGLLIKEDDFLDLTYSEKTDDGILVGGSYVLDRPTLMFNERPRFPGDLFSALALLSEGDSAVVKINIDSAVKRVGFVRPRLCKGKYLVYTLRINKMIARNGLSDEAYQAAIENFRRADNNRNKALETLKLGRYLRYKKKMQQRPSGLYCQVLNAGTGHSGIAGDTVYFNYTASYLSGSVFQTNLSGVAKSNGIYNPSRSYHLKKPF